MTRRWLGVIMMNIRLVWSSCTLALMYSTWSKNIKSVNPVPELFLKACLCVESTKDHYDRTSKCHILRKIS